LTPKVGGKVGLPAPNPGGTGVARVGSADDSGLFATGAGPQRTQLRHLAGAAAARVAAGRMWNDGAGESVFARALCGRVQPAISPSGGAARKRFYALPEAGSGTGVFGAVGARRESRQHGEFPESVVATRAGAVESHAGGMPGDGASASGWH